MTAPKRHVTPEEADNVSATLKNLSETQPPDNKKTKGTVIAENQERIQQALDRGWTQKAIVDAIYTETGVSITTETLRAHLKTVRRGKRPKRVAERDQLQKRAKRDKPRRRKRTQQTQTEDRSNEKRPAGSAHGDRDETDGGTAESPKRPHAGTVEEDY